VLTSNIIVQSVLENDEVWKGQSKREQEEGKMKMKVNRKNASPAE
jgi:hypothetical protein